MPFLKWAGGKRQLLSELQHHLPTKFNRYFEPFVGAGALFFDLAKPGSYIADINPQLIDTYKVLADENMFMACIDLLRQHRDSHSSDHYKAIRNVDRHPEFNHWTDVQRAARFIYLNKTGFNGIWRVNQKGFNNVPIGDSKSPAILNEANLLLCHHLLRTTEIVCTEFEAVLDRAVAGDLVYFDPPYVPLSATSSFTAYTRDGFTQTDQQNLRQIIDRLHRNGVFVMVSNSYCDETQKLYQGYQQIAVDAARMVNSRGNGRGKIHEMLVTTFEPPSDVFILA